MTWLTWRQSRLQALTAAAALIAIALAYGLTGPGLARLYTRTCGTGDGCAGHTAQFLAALRADAAYPLLYFAGIAIMYFAPLIIGAFWGAPLVARELEAGTHRLAWNQSVTRSRWLAAKLAIGAVAAMTFAGLTSLLVTWWAVPIEKAGGFPAGISQLSRFQPLIFSTRGIVPVGTAALAFALGVTAGLLLRRVLPAMAVTLAAFAVALVVMPMWVSPHLISPAQFTHPVIANLTTMQMTGSGQLNDPVTNMPGAWILTDQIITKSGTVFTLPDVPACQTGTRDQCDTWLASQRLFQHVVYQPASRYWAYQWYETGIWLALAAALSAVCFWRIRTR
jgi:ABC-type transport system involved in multi-copper enzyme maturation permease subunit